MLSTLKSLYNPPWAMPNSPLNWLFPNSILLLLAHSVEASIALDKIFLSFVNFEHSSKTIRMSELRQEVKDTFRVGDIVGIDHKKISSSEDFRIYKINNKNIKVQSLRDNSEYTVSPSLLVKR